MIVTDYTDFLQWLESGLHKMPLTNFSKISYTNYKIIGNKDKLKIWRIHLYSKRHDMYSDSLHALSDIITEVISDEVFH